MWKLSEFECNEFEAEIEENGFTFFSKMKNRIVGFYPSPFPHFSPIPIEDIEEDDLVSVRAFFRIGSGKSARIESGIIDMRIECITEDNEIWGEIKTELPKKFPLGYGTSINLSIDEILSFSEYEPEIVQW